MKRIHFFWFLLTLLILNSCSIEKRRYTSGFHVEWHHDRKISQQQFTERKNDSLHHISARPITAIEDERKETKEEKQPIKHRLGRFCAEWPHSLSDCASNHVESPTSVGEVSDGDCQNMVALASNQTPII